MGLRKKDRTAPEENLWESQWQKRRFVWTKKHTRVAIFALVGVLCVAFIGWRHFTAGGGTVEEHQADFNAYVFELMEEYKPDLMLYDRLADPQALLAEEGWQVTRADTDQPEEPVRQLLGEGCVIYSWEDLKQAEADRLWQEWYYGDEEIRSDVFTIREISRHIDYRTLPALRENTWLVEPPNGIQYLLVRWEDQWGLQQLSNVR